MSHLGVPATTEIQAETGGELLPELCGVFGARFLGWDLAGTRDRGSDGLERWSAASVRNVGGHAWWYNMVDLWVELCAMSDVNNIGHRC